MRIVIQDSKGESYFDGDTWTPDIVKAMDFESTAVAERFCLERKLSDAVIVVRFISSADEDIRFVAGNRATARDVQSLHKPKQVGRWR